MCTDKVWLCVKNILPNKVVLSRKHISGLEKHNRVVSRQLSWMVEWAYNSNKTTKFQPSSDLTLVYIKCHCKFFKVQTFNISITYNILTNIFTKLT